jgi:hypothetical protein
MPVELQCDKAKDRLREYLSLNINSEPWANSAEVDLDICCKLRRDIY